jgi:hypothetical protein
VISSWDELHARQIGELENGHGFWVSGGRLRPEMSGKFGRIYDRVQRRLEREMTPFAYAVADSRQYVGVTARKHRARKRGKR